MKAGDRNEVVLSRTWDIIYASPLIALYAFVVAGLLYKLRPEFVQLYLRTDAFLVLTVVQQLLTAAFAALQVWLFLTRDPPSRRSQGFGPRAAAILGSNAAFGFLLLPNSAQSPSTLILSTLIIAFGTAASIYAAAWLGRCFAILPQVRGLVVDGPYRVVRHPLYLAELVTLFGVALQFREPWSFLLYGCVAAVQIFRMHYEEQTLESAYPAYRAYAAQVSRLIPRVY